MTTSTNNPFDPTALANGTSLLTMRTNALNLSEDLQQAGTLFNDAVRLSEGGLWNLGPSASDVGNQQPYEQMYQADITAVLDDVNAMLANPGAMTVNGTAFVPSATDTGVLSQVQGQLQTLLNEANASVGNSPAGAQAQDLIHATQTQIIQEIQGDASLVAALNHPYASGTGATNTGFQDLPVGSDSTSALAAATAQGATLEQIGMVFNAANDLAAGGLNSTNLTEFNTDYQAVATGMQNLINNPNELAQIEANETPAQAALTTVHLDTILNQVDLQINRFDPMYAVDQNIAARSTNDNTLDIIDIVQNDPSLQVAAGGTNPGANGGNATGADGATPSPSATVGFAEFPAYLNAAGGVNAHGGTINQYQDDQAQTDFWSQFIAGANQINTQLDNVAATTTPVPTSDLNALIQEIQNYHEFGASFDNAQGGVFGARFDNELLSGTLLADTNNAVAGLTAIVNNGGVVTTAAGAQIEAAGSGFVADANDVSGNNLPLGGTGFNGASTTVAGATTPTGLPSATATVPVSGEVDGNDQPTSGVNFDVSNNGFGVTFPNPNATTTSTASGAGTAGTATAGGGTAPVETTTDPTTTPGTSSGTPSTTGSGSTTGESSAVASDIAALIQALEHGTPTAVNAAVAALGAALNGSGGGGASETGSSSAGGSSGAAANGTGSPCAGGGNGSAANGTGNALAGGGTSNTGTAQTPTDHHHFHFEHMWHF
jgi:hypothetical protein